MNGVLIGRVSELARIRALEQQEGATALVVVGDPGSGKSRLLAEAAAESARRVFRVVGYEPERLVPLAAAGDLLRAVAADTAFGPAAGTTVAPVRIFEATQRALQEVGPVLLAVDDVQWIDDLSLALLHYVVRAVTAGGGNVLVLAAGRPAARTHGLATDLAALLAPGRAEVLELGGLPREDGLRLARALDPTLGEADAAAVWERSGGLPFWIEALARAGGQPVDAGRLLTTRLRDSGKDAVSLLALLAVVARPVAETAAASLLGWPPERVDAAGNELLARGVAVRSRETFAVAHDLIRAAAYEELPEPRRRDLHRLVADRLEESAGEDVSALREALEHRASAGDPTVALAARLVSSPQRRRLGDEGLAALAALADDPAGRGDDFRTLRAGVAALAFELGDHRLAFERWTAFARSAVSSQERFEASLGAAKAAVELGWTYAAAAHELLAAARASAGSDEDRVAAAVHEARVLLWLDHKTPEGAAVARTALEQSRALGTTPRQRRVRLEALNAARQAAMQEADGEAILSLAEEALAEASGSDDDDAYAEALFGRAIGQQRTDPLPVAEATARAVRQLATRRVLPLLGAEAGFFLAAILHDRGELDEAERSVVAAEQLARRVETVMPGRQIGGEIVLVRGDVDRGMREYLAETDDRPDAHVRIIPRHLAAQFLSRVAGPDGRGEVVAQLRKARQDADEAACPRCLNELQVITAAALARVGLAAESEAALAECEAVQPRDRYTRLVRDYARAVVASARAPTDAIPMLEEVCAEAEQLDRRLELLWARVDLARALRLAGPERATETLREVACASDEIGAHAIRAVAERELRRLGVRTWRRGRSRTGDGSLSERERQVAELVATGASNPEIAQALFLSRKTVERHVSNALAKSGARNRAELAALLAREGEGAHR